MRKIAQLFVTTFLVIGLFVAVIGNMAATTFAAESYVTPPGVTLLTGDEIRDALIGNTAWYPNGALEYCTSDGKCIGESGGVNWNDASWAIDGSVICFTYPNHPRWGGCRTLSKHKDAGAFIFHFLDGSVRFEKVSTFKGRKYL